MSSPKLSEVVALLQEAYATLGTWDLVAERVGDVTGEGLRLIAEGETKRPFRKTVDAIVVALGSGVSDASGAARQVEETLRHLRSAVQVQEGLLARLKSTPGERDRSPSTAPPPATPRTRALPEKGAEKIAQEPKPDAAASRSAKPVRRREGE